MDTRHTAATQHTHPCGHDCECKYPDELSCDRDAIAQLVRTRHQLEGVTDGEIMTRLLLSMMSVAGREGVGLHLRVIMRDARELSDAIERLLVAATAYYTLPYSGEVTVQQDDLRLFLRAVGMMDPAPAEGGGNADIPLRRVSRDLGPSMEDHRDASV